MNDQLLLFLLLLSFLVSVSSLILNSVLLQELNMYDMLDLNYTGEKNEPCEKQSDVMQMFSRLCLNKLSRLHMHAFQGTGGVENLVL